MTAWMDPEGLSVAAEADAEEAIGAVDSGTVV
jgi:hypothetical protein